MACRFQQSTGPGRWILEPWQYDDTFPLGTVGINSAQNNIRTGSVNVDSYLSRRNDINSKCSEQNHWCMKFPNTGPCAKLSCKNNETNANCLTNQQLDFISSVTPVKKQNSVASLQPIYSKQKKSADNLGAFSYIPLTFNPNLFVDPQDINNIIIKEANRGGLNTSQWIKERWNTDECEQFLDPQRACGKKCSEVNGYMTRLPMSNKEPTWGKLPKGWPSDKWTTPSMTNTQPGIAAKRQPIRGLNTPGRTCPTASWDVTRDSQLTPSVCRINTPFPLVPN